MTIVAATFEQPWSDATEVCTIGNVFVPGPGSGDPTDPVSDLDPTFIIPAATKYNLAHVVTIIDLRDNAALDFFNFTMSTDDASVCWTLNANGPANLFDRFAGPFTPSDADSGYWDPASVVSPNWILSNGNKTATGNGATNSVVRGFIGRSDPRYFEIKINTLPASNQLLFGLATIAHSLGVKLGYTVQSVAYDNTGQITFNGASLGVFASPGAGGVIGFAVKNGKVWIRVNGTFINSGDPVAGTGQQATLPAGVDLFPCACMDAPGTTAAVTLRVNASEFSSLVPTGFGAWGNLGATDFDIANYPIISIVIDGQEWWYMIEGVRRNRSFANTTVTLIGRSITILAGEPYSFIQNWVNTGPISAAQIVDQAQDLTTMTVEWGLEDWLVPDRVWYFSGSPLQVVQRVAESVKAVVRSDRKDYSIAIIPRYPTLPHLWPGTAPDVEIHADAMMTDSYDRADRPAYNAVMVSGQQQGVTARVYLQGTAADKMAPLVTDLLLTDTPALQQRGMSELGASGEQAKIGMTLPVITEGQGPGVLNVGYLCHMLDDGDDEWWGMVRSVSVAVQLPNIAQSINFERHTGVIEGTVIPPDEATAPDTPAAGLLAKTLANVTLVAHGQLPSSGVVSKTLANVTLVATGTLGVSGTLSKTLANVTLVATGVLAPIGAFDPASVSNHWALSNNNRTATNSIPAGGTGPGDVRSIIGRSDGRYVEIEIFNQVSGQQLMFGLCNASHSSGVKLGYDTNSLAYDNLGLVTYNGSNGGVVTPVANNHVIQVAMNSAGKIWFGVDGTYISGGNPAAGTGEQGTLTGTLKFAIHTDIFNGGGSTVTPGGIVRSTAAMQSFSPPSGSFTPWDD